MSRNFVTGKGRRKPTPPPPPPPRPSLLKRILLAARSHPTIAAIVYIVGALVTIGQAWSYIRSQVADLKPTFSAPIFPSSSLFGLPFGITNNGSFVAMYNLSFSCKINTLKNANGGGSGNFELSAGGVPSLAPGDTAYYKCPVGQIGDLRQPAQPVIEFPPVLWLYGKIKIIVTYQVGVQLFGHWFLRPMKATSGQFFFITTDSGYEWESGVPVN